MMARETIWRGVTMQNCDICGKEVKGDVYGIVNVNIDYSWCDVAEEVSRFIHPDCYYEYKENNNA